MSPSQNAPLVANIPTLSFLTLSRAVLDIILFPESPMRYDQKVNATANALQ